MFKKILCSVLASGLMLSISLTGCSSQSKANGSASSSSTTQNAVISFWFMNSDSNRQSLFTGLINTFETQNPNIKVNFLGVSGDGMQKLEMAVAANATPDTSDMLQNSTLVSQGALYPLDNYFNNWSEKDEVVASAITTARSYDMKNHKLYCLPMASNVMCMWVRPDWFKAAGLSLPKTWTDFFNDVPKLTDKSKGQYGLGIRGGAGGGVTLEYLMYSYSGILDYFDKNGKCTINDPKNVEFVQKYLNLYGTYTQEGDINNGWPALAAEYQSGKAAMVFHNLGSSAVNAAAFNNDNSKFAALPYPASSTGYTVTPALQVSAYCIYKNSKYKDADWQFISYLSSKDAASESAKMIGIMPVNKEALNASWVKNLPYFNTMSQALSSSKTEYYNEPFNYPDYASTISTKIEPMIQQVMAKKMTAQELCNQWADLMTKMKAEDDAEISSGASS